MFDILGQSTYAQQLLKQNVDFEKPGPRYGIVSVDSSGMSYYLHVHIHIHIT